MGFHGGRRPGFEPERRAESLVEGKETREPVNIKRLLGYVRPYKGRLVLALVALLVTSGIGLVFPYIIQNLIDGVLQTGDKALLNRIAGGLVLLFLLRLPFGYMERYLLEYTGEKIVVDIRNQLYEHLHRLSVRFFTDRRTGEIVSRLASDVTLVRTALTTNLSVAISQGVTLIGALVIVIIINLNMTLFILAMAPAMGLISVLFGRLVRRLSTKVQDELAGSSTIVEEVLQSIRVVKSFVREQFEINRYRDSMERIFNVAMKMTQVRAAFQPLVFSIMFMAIVGLLWFGGNEVIEDRLTAGGLTSFLFYLMFIAGSFGAFTGLYTQLQEAMGATRRIFEILDMAPEVQDKPDARELGAAEGRITFEDVSFAYDERMAVLDGIALEVQPGEVLALVGPSGAGKSTLFSLIPRFYDPTAGRVRVDGHDLRDVTQASLRAQIGIVPQETLLFGGTIRENILYGRLDASQAELIEAARAANAHDFIMELPDGYDTVVGERGIKLSGGQRQRVAIARAILKNPRILLLDEATSSLDSESEGLVQEALERLMQGRTTVIIAHRLSTVQVANRIAVLDRGRLVELGRHEELLGKEDGLYARLYRMQFEAGLSAMIEAGLD